MMMLLCLSLVAAASAQGVCEDACDSLASFKDDNGVECFCDNKCAALKDCCPLREEACNIGTGGSQCEADCVNLDPQVDIYTGMECYCDPDCFGWGDCCTGYEGACGGDQSINLEVHPTAREALVELKTAISAERKRGVEKQSNTCFGICGQTASRIDEYSGEVCYCDEECTNWDDCCTGFFHHCDHPARIERLDEAFSVSDPAQDSALCMELADSIESGCSGSVCDCPCVDAYPECTQYARQGYCSQGHSDGTKAGWFQWKCPEACGAC